MQKKLWKFFFYLFYIPFIYQCTTKGSNNFTFIVNPCAAFPRFNIFLTHECPIQKKVSRMQIDSIPLLWLLDNNRLRVVKLKSRDKLGVEMVKKKWLRKAYFALIKTEINYCTGGNAGCKDWQCQGISTVCEYWHPCTTVCEYWKRM